jgi:hypothetical protein
MDEKHERNLRRQAMRRLMQGERPTHIARALQRSRKWVYTWWQRFAAHGRVGLHSQSRRPHHPAQRYGEDICRLIVRTRRTLERNPVGLQGPDAVRRTLQQGRVRPLPSRATIARVLQREGLTHPPLPPSRSHTYYPHPRPTPHFRLHAMDWTARYLPGGAKAFVFNTVDYASRDLHSQLYSDKTVQTACAHALGVWRSPLGLPDGLQLDNDALFCGGYRGRRVFGQFVRLCLYVGVEPIFLPFYEPQRNELVESLHGLWQQAFWKRRRFRSLRQAKRCHPQFEHWYRHEYVPPGGGEQTPAQASRTHQAVRLSAAQIRQMPAPLPITAGRVHFIRLVDARGEVVILNERWRVGRRWAGKYVWATMTTDQQRLDVYSRRSARHPVRHLKTWHYELPEPVAALRPDFHRRLRRRKMSTML